MCRRFHFDNCLSLIGAWIMFFTPYWPIRILIECVHQNKYSTHTTYFELYKESLWELNWRYWWRK